MRKTFVLMAAAAAACPAGVETVAAQAVNQVRAHANMCMPATNDLTRTTYGLRNNTGGNRSVYCGFEVREGGLTGYDNFSVVLRNYSETARSVSCYWTSGNPFSGGYATATTTAMLPGDGGELNFVSGFDLSRPNEFATLGLRCALPPNVAMEYIQLEPIVPAT